MPRGGEHQAFLRPKRASPDLFPAHVGGREKFVGIRRTPLPSDPNNGNVGQMVGCSMLRRKPSRQIIQCQITQKTNQSRKCNEPHIERYNE